MSAVRLIRKGLQGLLLGAGMLLLSCDRSALAEPIPGIGDIPAGYYFTTDMEPVEVLLRVGMASAPDEEPQVRMSIPRAYIYFAGDYPQRKFGELPPEIDVNSLHIMLTYPDGLPYSVAIEKRRAEPGRFTGQALEELRTTLFVASIHPTVGDAHASRYLSPLPDLGDGDLVGEYQGLRFYQVKSGRSTYFGKRGDMLRRIQCWNPPERLDPGDFCAYFTVLSKHVYAKLSFVDFRAHGGVAFARDRVNRFRAAICRYLACDRAR